LEAVVFVKKIQVLSFQAVNPFARFARTRPSDFNFEMMAFLKGKNETFVLFFQKDEARDVPRERRPLATSEGAV